MMVVVGVKSEMPGGLNVRQQIIDEKRRSWLKMMRAAGDLVNLGTRFRGSCGVAVGAIGEVLKEGEGAKNVITMDVIRVAEEVERVSSGEFLH